MSEHSRTGRSLQLSGKTVAADIHLHILSFLDLKDLLRQRNDRVSHAWGINAETALSRIGSISVSHETLYDAHWCGRLGRLRIDGRDLDRLDDCYNLIRQHRATLTALHFEVFHFPGSRHRDAVASIRKAIRRCRSLRQLDYIYSRWDAKETAKLVSACSLLEDLKADVDWNGLLSAAQPLPLKRLKCGRELQAAHLARLATALPDLQELETSIGKMDPATLFEGLARLPRLSVLFLPYLPAFGESATAPPSPAQRPVFRALHFLVLSLYEEPILYFFSAPGLQRLDLSTRESPHYSLLIERFPALTSLDTRCPEMDEKELKSAVALLSGESRPWRQLRKLRLSNCGARLFAPFLSRLGGGGRLSALAELNVSDGTLSRRELLSLLRDFPSLTSLTLVRTAWRGEEEEADERVEGKEEEEEADSGAAVHGLEMLDLHDVDADLLCALGTSFRFPRLRSLSLFPRKAAAGWNLLPMLLHARETLRRLQIPRNTGLRLSIPPGTAEAERRFPRLRAVYIDPDCEVDEDARQALGPDRHQYY